MSELETSGLHPKIPSPQAQPAVDRADTSVEGKEGTAPVSKSRSLLHPAPVPWPIASSCHHCLHLLYWLPCPEMGQNTHLVEFLSV